MVWLLNSVGGPGGPASRNDNTNGPEHGRMASYLPARLLGRVETNMHWKCDIPVEKLSRALCPYSTQRGSLDHKDKFSEARTCVKLLVHMLSLTITLRVVAWRLTHVGTHPLAELLPESKGELWPLKDISTTSARDLPREACQQSKAPWTICPLLRLWSYNLE